MEAARLHSERAIAGRFGKPLAEIAEAAPVHWGRSIADRDESFG